MFDGMTLICLCLTMRFASGQENTTDVKNIYTVSPDVEPCMNKNAFQSKAHHPLADRKSNTTFWGGGVPRPSFPGSSSSPSQLVLRGGCLGPPSQVLPSVLPSWSFGGVPGPSFPGPSSSPSQLVLRGGGTQVLIPRYFQQSFPAGPSRGIPRPSFPGPSSSPSQLVLQRGGFPRDLSHNALDVTCLLPSASWERSHWTPQLDRLTDRQTCLKTLPSQKLRMRAVKM